MIFLYKPCNYKGLRDRALSYTVSKTVQITKRICEIISKRTIAVRLDFLNSRLFPNKSVFIIIRCTITEHRMRSLFIIESDIIFECLSKLSFRPEICAIQSLSIPGRGNANTTLNLTYHSTASHKITAYINYANRSSETNPNNNTHSVTVNPKSSDKPEIDYLRSVQRLSLVRYRAGIRGIRRVEGGRRRIYEKHGDTSCAARRDRKRRIVRRRIYRIERPRDKRPRML